MRTSLIAILGGAFLLTAPALAQDNADAIKSAVGAPRTDQTGLLNGDMSFGMLDGDIYTTLRMGLSMDLGQIGFGVQVPLRIRLMDNDPQNEAESAFREEDWNEFSDYLRIIRYFRWGHKGDFIYAMVGDFPGASLGHGTIINRYYNNVDLNHYKMGIALDLNTDYGGVETMINNVVLPNLFGVRGYVRPWSFVDTESYLNNLAVGFSVAADAFAPYTLAVDVDGNGLVEDGYPKVAEQRAATIIGGDVEFRVLNTSWLTLTPYMDLNGILDAGLGYHAGVMSVFHVPLVNLDLQTRLEYRYFEADYIPAYFDSFYEIQKFEYPFKDETVHAQVWRPKRAVIDSLGGRGLNGYYAEAVFSFLGMFNLGASYDDYDGPYNSNLRLYLDVPALEIFQFGAYYYKHNFEGADQAFTFDDKSLFLVEAKYQIASFLYLVGKYWRIWQLDNNPASGTFGEYTAVSDWSVGLGASYSF